MSGNIFELSQSSVFESSYNDLCLRQFLKSCSEQGVFFRKDNVEAWVKTVNNSLNSSLNKEKGLLFLVVGLPQITVEAYSRNAVTWLTHCIKIINNKSNLEGLALNVLGKLIKSSSNFPEICKETAKHVIPKFLQDNVKRERNSEVSLEFLHCLQICLQEYSGPSIDFKNELVRLLLSEQILEGKREVVQSAAKCVVLLAQLGGGGKQGISHKTAWHQQQLSLVALLHKLLNNIYQLIYCAVENEDETLQDQIFKLKEVKDKDTLINCQRHATQFGSICQFLQSMLLEEFATSKQIAPVAILDVISHAQKPTHMTLGTSREELAVMAVMPTVQSAALRLLEALILSLGRNMIPQGGLINFFCSQAIVWTNKQREDWPYAMDKPFRHTRFVAYCCLHSWLIVTGASNQVDILLDKPLTIMLADIHSEKPTVKLKVGCKQSRGKKQHMLIGLEERSDKLADPLANDRLCERALLTLSHLLRAAPLLFKPNTYMNICQTVLTVLEELPVPYSNVSCLCALYQLLLTLCSEPPPNTVPPFSAALSAFIAGSHHSTTQVKSACLSAISYLEKVIHPVAATLQFSLPQVTMVSNEDSHSQDTEEVDSSEPETKKRKLDFESSDSMSLQISEDEIQSIEEIIISDAKSKSSESNDSLKVTFENINENQNSPVIPTDDLNIKPTINLEPTDIENNIVTHKVNKPVLVDDANLLATQDTLLTSSHALLLEKNGRNIELNLLEDNKSEDKLTTETHESQEVSNEMSEDISQMLMDFKDEVIEEK